MTGTAECVQCSAMGTTYEIHDLNAAIARAAKATIARLERAARDGYDVREQLAEQRRRLASVTK